MIVAAAFMTKKLMDDMGGDEMFGMGVMMIPNIEAIGEDKCEQFKTDALAKLKTAARWARVRAAGKTEMSLLFVLRPLVDQIFAFFDKDGDGEVTWEEFATIKLLMEKVRDRSGPL